MRFPVVRRLLIDLRPLRASPDFRRLFLGSAVSQLDGQMTTFAVALQIFSLTGSSAAVGGVGSLAGPGPAAAIGGVSSLVGTAVITLALPALHRFRTPRAPAPSA